MEQNKKDIKIEIKLDENIASGNFTNFTNISYSPDEYIFDFLFIHPTPPPGFGKLMSRVVLTPSHAKKFLQNLTNNLNEYEKRFGEIQIKDQAPEIKNLQ